MTRVFRRDWRDWTVAITGINAHAENPGPGMAVARCLVEHPEFRGRVIGLAYDALDAGLYARDYFSESYLIPYPSEGEDALLDRLSVINEEECIDVIIPCLDSEMTNFIRLRSCLAELGIKMLVPNRAQFAMRAKDHLVGLCQSTGIAVPKTKILTDASFFDRIESLTERAGTAHAYISKSNWQTLQDPNWHYPLVVKGIFYDAAIVRNPTEAKNAFGRLVYKWGYPCMAQEVVKGEEINLAGIGDGTGRLVGQVTMRKKALTDKGKAWAGVSIIDQAMLETAEKLVAALMWRGPLEVEAIRAENGKIYLIEINPRFPSWIYLSKAVGSNLPVAVLKLLANQKDLGLAPARSGCFFIRHAQELVLDLPEFESVLMTGRSRSISDTGTSQRSAS